MVDEIREHVRKKHDAEPNDTIVDYLVRQSTER